MTTFEETIKTYLDKRASEDALFAITYAKQNKSIEECCKYIIGEAYKNQKGNSAVLSDEVVFGMAVHYYDEDNIKITDIPHGVGCREANNGAKYEPTEEDKENAKRDALRRLEQEAYNEIHGPKKSKVTKQVEEAQMSLF